jgi:hypothetical protein
MAPRSPELDNSSYVTSVQDALIVTPTDNRRRSGRLELLFIRRPL